MNKTSCFLLPNHLVTRTLDRLAERRRDPAWLAAQLAAESTRFILVRESRVLVDGQRAEPAFLSPPQLRGIPDLAERVILLGAQGDRVFFAMEVTGDAAPVELRHRGRFADLRHVAPGLQDQECALLALAKAMVYWHQCHRFCGGCGGPTASREAGFLRICPNPDCREQHFPRTDPAIIVLVTSGDRCLLARAAAWAEGLRSTLAGFVEPGETLERAVVREVREETGIEVTDIRYRWSQPWPFPTSLMLGFTACARDTTVRIDEEELEDARWFTRAQIRSGIEEGSLVLPSQISIARRLIQAWFDTGDCGLLEEVDASR